MAGPPTRRPRSSRCWCPPSARRRSGAPAIWWSRLGRAAGDLSPWGSDLAARRGVSSRRRAQHQPVSRFALDLRAGVDEREILAFRPKRQQVVVVRTAGLARLARHARRDRAVPVGEVEDLSIGRAPTLLVTLARGGVDGVGITAPRHVSQVERRGHGMAEGRAVQGAPRDRKSTRLNSSHGYISYAVFCL